MTPSVLPRSISSHSSSASPDPDAMGDIDDFLGSRLRRRRRMLKLTLQNLADMVGVRFQQIQKYECGASRISAARLWRLAEALGVPVNYFYEGFTLKAPMPQSSAGRESEQSLCRDEMLARVSFYLNQPPSGPDSHDPMPAQTVLASSA